MIHRRSFTTVIEYNFFEPGQLVIPIGPVATMSIVKPLVVVRTLAPLCAMDGDSTVFVAGEKYGIDGRRLRSIDNQEHLPVKDVDPEVSARIA